MKRIIVNAAIAACCAAAVLAPGIGTAKPATPKAHAANTVPNVVGKYLPAAKRRIRAAGLRPKAVGGGIFGIVVESNWVVCGQTPSPGSSASSGRTVKLYVSRPGNC